MTSNHWHQTLTRAAGPQLPRLLVQCANEHGLTHADDMVEDPGEWPTLARLMDEANPDFARLIRVAIERGR